MKIVGGVPVDESFVGDDHSFGTWDDGSKHWEIVVFSPSRAAEGGYSWEHEVQTDA